MSLWKKLTGELVDIIEWLDASPDTLVWRFERHNNEIKNGARLIVRETQAAVFVNEGQLADIFKFAGTYTLKTQNLPILSTLQGWKHGFESPFKAEVYFVNLRQFTDQKWGTMNPVMLRDPEFGPLRLRGFGTYTMRVADPAALVRELVGTNPTFTTEGIAEQLRSFIVSQMSDILGEAKIPALDLAAHYNELGAFAVEKLRPRFAEYGLELTAFAVQNLSLPPEVEQALDRRTSMGITGDLGKYTQFQAAEALRTSSNQSGGGGGGAGGAMAQGMGMAAGLAMGQQMAGALAGAGATGTGGVGAGGPPALPALSVYLAIEGKQAGPFTLAQAAEIAASGRINADTLAWRAGMPNWAPAGTIAELAGLFGRSTPPPLPG